MVVVLENNSLTWMEGKGKRGRGEVGWGRKTNRDRRREGRRKEEEKEMKQGEREYRNTERVERQNRRTKQGPDYQELCPPCFGV